MKKKGPSGRNEKKVRVKTARGRKLSSTRWLQRQLNDPYVHEAKRQGYRSRAAFKLEELNDKFKFLKKGAHVVDLGAAPGGWLQVIAEHVQPDKTGGSVIGIDLLEIEPLPGAICLQGDFLEQSAYEQVKSHVGDKLDVVLSDMAAATTGHTRTDHLRIIGLAEAALDFAEEMLKEGGTFVAKVFEGGSDHDLLMRLRKNFSTIKHVKPKSSRKESSEMYVVALNFGKKSK